MLRKPRSLDNSLTDMIIGRGGEKENIKTVFKDPIIFCLLSVF